VTRSLSPTSGPSAGRGGAARLFAGGVEGNELLTVAAGAVLIVLLAVIGVTIVALGRFLSVHLFVGMMLLGPLALKLSSTGYRFVRYYTNNPRYRQAGPPITPLRLIAPIVVISTVIVFASGVALLLAGPGSRSTLLPIHKVSFIVWVAFTSLHVLGHLPTLARGLSADYAPAAELGGTPDGRTGRVLSLAGAITAGVVLAILFIPQFSPWLNHFRHH
jgi:hypothetical protein